MTDDARAPQAHALFRAGHDTMAVASRLKVSQSLASRLVWLGRCQAKGLSARYINHNGAMTEANPDHLRKSA